MEEQPKAPPGNPTGANQYGSGIGLSKNPIPKPITLNDAGIDKNLAHRARIAVSNPLSLGGFAYPSPVRIRTTLKAEAALVCAVAPDCAALTAWSGSLHRAALSGMASVGQLEARARVVGNLLWPPLLKKRGKEMLAVIYTFGVSVVAAFLFAAVDAIEPNRRYASVLKFLIVFVSVGAIAGRVMP
jgi:hypothetical protein